MNFEHFRFPEESIDTLRVVLTSKFNEIQISKFTDWLIDNLYNDNFESELNSFKIAVDRMSYLLIYHHSLYYDNMEQVGYYKEMPDCIRYINIFDNKGKRFHYNYRNIKNKSEEFQQMHKLIKGNSKLIISAKANIDIEKNDVKAFSIKDESDLAEFDD